MLTIGREVVYGSSTSMLGAEVVSYGDYVQFHKRNMQLAHEVARENLASTALRNKEVYDARLSTTNYQVGDEVWLLAESRQPGVTPTLESVPHCG